MELSDTPWASARSRTANSGLWSLQHAPRARFDVGPDLRLRNESLQHSQVGINNDIGIIHRDGALDGSCEETHFAGDRETHYVAVPALVLVANFHRSAGETIQQLIQALIDSAHRLLASFVVRNSN